MFRKYDAKDAQWKFHPKELYSNKANKPKSNDKKQQVA